MYRRFNRKTPWRAHEPWVALIRLGARRNRHARMQVEGHVQFRHRRPEAAVRWNVIVDRRIRGFFLREAIDECTLEAEILYTAYQFFRRRIRVLHGKRRETGKAMRTPG